MDKPIIIIGNRNTGITTITQDYQDKKINDCLNCVHGKKYIIVCNLCSKMFKNIKVLRIEPNFIETSSSL